MTVLVFRSDAPLPEVPPPLHETPSAHRPFIDSDPDSAEFDSLSGDDSDGGASLAEDVKGKTAGSLGRDESLEAEVGASCPEKTRTAVRKRRASGDVSPGPAPKQRRVMEGGAPPAAAPNMAELLRRASGVGWQPSEGIPIGASPGVDEESE